MIGGMKTAGLVLLALVLPVTALPAADDYVIRLTRPSKVGERYRVDAKGTERNQERLTVGGQVQNDDSDISVHLIAVATVLAVDNASQATRIEYLIETCKKTSSGATEKVLSAGRRVVAESDDDDDTVFTVDGDPALEDVSEALSVVISAHPPDSPSDDQIFGTPERKRVGDTWSIDSGTAAAYFSKAGLVVSAEDLKGTVTLVGVRTIGGVKALEITAHIGAERMTMDLPEWLRIEKTSMTGDFTGFVPMDPQASSHLPDKLRLHFSILGRGRKPETGSTVVMDVVMERSLEQSYAPLPEKMSGRSDLASLNR